METKVLSYLSNNKEDFFISLRKEIEEAEFQKSYNTYIINVDKKPSKGTIERIRDYFSNKHYCVLSRIVYIGEHELYVINDNIHNGEHLKMNKPCVILGSINQGAEIDADHDICICGDIQGRINLKNGCQLFLRNAINTLVHFENGDIKRYEGHDLYVTQENEEIIWQE